MNAGIIRNSIAWTLLSGSWLVAGATQESNPTSTDCSANAEVRRTIETALHARGLNPNGLRRLDSLRCSAPISASGAFVVTRVRRDPMLNTIDFRLNCVPQSACLPFLVSVPDQQLGRVSAEELPARVQRGSSSSLFDGGRQHLPLVAEPDTPIVVMPGQRLTLLWEKANVRLTRKVICLDRGRPGEEIRTRPVGPGQVVRARVLNAEYVRAIS